MKKQRESQKSRYAALAQFIAMANLLDPRNEYPPLASLDDELDAQLAIGQAAEVPEEARYEAWEKSEQARVRRAELIEPLWRQAVEVFSAPAHYAPQRAGAEDRIAAIIRADGQDYPLASAAQFYDAALTARDTLRMLAARRAERLPIQMPASAAPRVQIMEDGTIALAKDLVRDFLLPALAGVNIDIIQLCPNCARLVLAARKREIQACSPACANIERVKKFRAENPDYYTADARRDRKQIAERAAKRKARRKLK